MPDELDPMPEARWPEAGRPRANGDAVHTAARRAARAFGLSMLLGVCAAAPAGAAARFVDATVEAGVGYAQSLPQHPPNCAFAVFFCRFDAMTGGATTGDIDGDHWPDLFVTTLYAPDRLLRNRGDGSFEDVTAAAGLPTSATNSNGALFADVDDDGDADLYVLSHGGHRHHLYINDGNGQFAEEALPRGAALSGAGPIGGTSAAAGDFDRDGWLDLFVAEWRTDLFAPGAEPNVRLLRNRGGEDPALAGHFADVTEAAGLAAVPPPSFPNLPGRYVLAPAFADLDGDGWPDLVLTSDFGTSQLLWNQGDGSFVDGTLAAGVGTDENGMGSALGDVEGDGDLDWFVTSIFDPEPACAQSPNWGCSGNRLYRNEGGRLFSDATDALGVRDGGWGWGTAFFDADNDGDLDLVMTNGVDFEDEAPDEAFHEDPMRYWENDGTRGMIERSAEVGLVDTGAGKALLVFDYDEDGDLDVFVANTRTGGRLFRNESEPEPGAPPNAWLRVRLEDRMGNREGRGARVRVTPAGGGPAQVREVGAGSHYLGESERVAHFGLGPLAPETDLLVSVEWLGGGVSYALASPGDEIEIVRSPPRGGCGLLGAELLVPLWLLRRSARWRRTRRPARHRAWRHAKTSSLRGTFRPRATRWRIP